MREREVVLDFIGEKKKKVVQENSVEPIKKKNISAPLAIKKSSISKTSRVENKNKTETVKIIFHVTTFGVALFLVFYSWFAFMVICFRVDNGYFRSLSKFLPVPAVVSKDVFVEYYQYKDQEDKASLQLLAKIKEERIWSFVD